MNRRAVNSVSLPLSGAGQWVHVLPSGRFAGRDGAGPYRLDDPQAVIEATLAAASGADLPIDYDHQLLWARENGQPAVAAGWIKAFEARPDGVWARVEWTPTAASRLADREYRYLSPVYWHDPDGTVLRIEHAALTNVPNLELTAVAARLRNEGGSMDLTAFLAALAAAFGLPAESTAEALVAHAKDLVGRGAATGAGLAAMAKALGLPETATAEAVGRAVAEHVEGVGDLAKVLGLSGAPKPAALAAQAKVLIAAKQEQGAGAGPDPSGHVPMEQHLAVANRLAALEKGLAEDKATSAVDAAMQAGKLIPANRDWALAYASKDPAGFGAFVAAAPVVVAPGRTGPTGQPKAGGELGEAELAVCSQLGIGQDEFKKHRPTGKEGD